MRKLSKMLLRGLLLAVAVGSQFGIATTDGSSSSEGNVKMRLLQNADELEDLEEGQSNYHPVSYFLSFFFFLLCRSFHYHPQNVYRTRP